MPQKLTLIQRKTMTTKTGLDLSLLDGIEDFNSGSRYPALQATRYTGGISEVPAKYVDENDPTIVKLGNEWYTKPEIGMKDDDYEALPIAVRNQIKAVKDSFNFSGGKSSDLYVLPHTTRYVVLSAPQIYIYNKRTKKITENDGESIGGDRVTIARLLLAVMIGDNLVLNESEEIQIFTMKLRSKNTMLIRDKKEAVNLFGINEAEQKKYGAKAKGKWLLALGTVKLDTTVTIFKSSSKDESSLGCKFYVANDFEALTPEQSKTITDLIKSETFRDFSRDPFGINRRSAPTSSVDDAEDFVDDDGIPF